MMVNEQTTLKEFFSMPEGLCQKKLSSIGAEESMLLFKGALDEAKVQWPVALKSITEKANEVLNINVSDIMVNAWNKYRILLHYLDRQKYPPDKTYLVPMVEHTIKSEHHPYVEVMINNVPVAKLDFDISVSLTFKGIVLKIQDGKVMEIVPGTCKGKGTFKCKKMLIMEKETKSFSLPKSIPLGKGIPVASG